MKDCHGRLARVRFVFRGLGPEPEPEPEPAQIVRFDQAANMNKNQMFMFEMLG